LKRAKAPRRSNLNPQAATNRDLPCCSSKTLHLPGKQCGSIATHGHQEAQSDLSHTPPEQIVLLSLCVDARATIVW
jgi:hypothetical protein